MSGSPIDGLMTSDELMLSELERRDGIYSFIFHELETAPPADIPIDAKPPPNGYSSGEDSIIQQYFNELLSSSPDICSEVTTRNRSLNAIVTTSAQTYVLPSLVPAMPSSLPRRRLGSVIVTKLSAHKGIKSPAARSLEKSPTPPAPPPPSPPVITTEPPSLAESPMLHERDPLMSMGATPPSIRSLETGPATVVQHTSAIRPLSTVLQHTSAIRPATTVLRHTRAVPATYLDVPLLKNEELLRPPSPLLEPANPPKAKATEPQTTDPRVMPSLTPLQGYRANQKAPLRGPSVSQRSYVRAIPPVIRQKGAATSNRLKVVASTSLERSPLSALHTITFVKPMTVKSLTAKPSATIIRPASPSSPSPCDQWDTSRPLPPISTLRPSATSTFTSFLGPSPGAVDPPRLSPFITWGNGYCHEYDVQRRPPPPYRPPSGGSSTQSPKSGLDLDMLDSYGPMSFGTYNFRILHRPAESRLEKGAPLVRNRKHALKETAEFKNFQRIVKGEPLPYSPTEELPDLRQLFPHDPDVHAPFKGLH